MASSPLVSSTPPRPAAPMTSTPQGQQPQITCALSSPAPPWSRLQRPLRGGSGLSAAFEASFSSNTEGHGEAGRLELPQGQAHSSPRCGVSGLGSR